MGSSTSRRRDWTAGEKVRLIVAVVISCVLYACTNDMTTQHPTPIEPLQWRGQLDQDSGYAYDWLLSYTDASMADPYLHLPIDLDAAVNGPDAGSDASEHGHCGHKVCR